MSKINIHRGTFLEKEELTRMLSFLGDSGIGNAMLEASVSYGMVSPGGERGLAFTPRVADDGDSISVRGGYIITSAKKSFKMPDTTITIPNDGKFYWLKISGVETHCEEGTVQVDVNGNVSGTVVFTGVVRSQSSGVPTCIRFEKADGTTLKNDKVYQVVDITNDTTVVLSGGYVFEPEQGLRVVVLGSIPMGNRFTDEQLEGLYTFTSCRLSLVEEQSANRPPDKSADEYYIARVRNVEGRLSYQDERNEYWSIGGSGGVVPPQPSEYEYFEVPNDDGIIEGFEVETYKGSGVYDSVMTVIG